MKIIKSMLTAVCLLVLVCFVGGCGNKPRATGALDGTMFDLSVATTIGNNTYIPIEKWSREADLQKEILTIKDIFEKTHPELKIFYWRTISRQRDGLSRPYVYGLEAHHEPRLKE